MNMNVYVIVYVIVNACVHVFCVCRLCGKHKGKGRKKIENKHKEKQRNNKKKKGEGKNFEKSFNCRWGKELLHMLCNITPLRRDFVACLPYPQPCLFHDWTC